MKRPNLVTWCQQGVPRNVHEHMYLIMKLREKPDPRWKY